MRIRRAQEIDFEDTSALELDLAGYLVFLFAFDTYVRWVKEVDAGDVENVSEEALHDLLRYGLRLMRRAESANLHELELLLEVTLPTRSGVRMMKRAIKYPTTIRGISQRALRLRTVLSRGGTSVLKAVFGKSVRARNSVKAAIQASTEDNADEALDKFSSITLAPSSKRLQRWIDKASNMTAPLGVTVANPLQEAIHAAADNVSEVKQQAILGSGAPIASETAEKAQQKQDEALQSAENTAKETAKRILENAGEKDEPTTRSEVIGLIAASKAIPAVEEDIQNLPPAFVNGKYPLDPEQQAAALTSGRVLVVAGAGAGKTTTMVSRIAYLVQEKMVRPSRILACSFNRKAATELKSKIGSKVGREIADQMNIGTMHSLFLRFIIGGHGYPAFGSPEEQAMFRSDHLIAPPSPGQKFKRGPRPADMTRAIQGIFKDCKDELPAYTGYPESYFDDIPVAKKCNLLMGVWKGNDVSYEEAKLQARNKNEKIAALWYEFYAGLKGDIPGWAPPCESKSADRFIKKYRRGGERLGDLDDQLKVFRDILRRDPKAKKQIQDMYDHIMVDEAQDRNKVQVEIFDLLSEHITDGSDGKSLWIVGDDKQAIYQFRGAQPNLFSSLDGKEGWKTRVIRTNYRCAPEIVEAANRLAEYNKGQIPMEAHASPMRDKGKSSIRVDLPSDSAQGAIETIAEIVEKTTPSEDREAEPYSNFAVLSRTNKELNDYETALALAEIPYTRRGGSGLFDSPEASSVLGYVDLVFGTDFEAMQKSLVDTLSKPNRNLYLSKDAIERAVKRTISNMARKLGVDERHINPLEFYTNGSFAQELAYNLKQANRNVRLPAFVFRKQVDQLVDDLLNTGDVLTELKNRLLSEDSGGMSSDDILNTLLDNITSTVRTWDPVARREIEEVMPLRQQIAQDVAMFGGSEDDAEESDEEKEANPAEGLGAVAFLFMLSTPTAADQEAGTDPTTAKGFVEKLTRIRKNADKLRIDMNQWEKEQLAKPEELREARPNCVTLSTVHSVKGSEWDNVTVVMKPGVFPFEPKPRPDEDPPTPEEQEAHMVAERNLAYVALTRAAKNLTVLCPQDSKVGGVSQFVREAGLVPGENVKPPTEEEGEVKTAYWYAR